MSDDLPIIIGISGASGAIFGIRLLEILRKYNYKTALVVSMAGQRTILEETKYKLTDIEALADIVYPVKDIGAKIASGSYKTRGMIIAPCSIKTMSEIANGITSSLMSRAADVCLKERRKLVLAVREMPLHTGHLRTMTQLSEMGAIITPPVGAFYHGEMNIDEMITQICLRLLSLFDIEIQEKKIW